MFNNVGTKTPNNKSKEVLAGLIIVNELLL